MSVLVLRDGLIDTIKNLHGITSDEAFARAIGVGARTVTRVRADPTSVQVPFIAGICTTFGYSPSDVVVAQ